MHQLYHLGLPWAGYLALLWVAPAHAGPAILCGWILFLVWCLLAPLRQPFDWRNPASWRQLSWLLVPALVGLSQPWRLGGSFAQALIELAILEFASFTFALAAVMAAWKAPDKGMAWPGIVMMLGFSGGLIYALLGGWRQLNPNPAWWQLWPLGLAWALAVYGHARHAWALAQGRAPLGLGLTDHPLAIVGIIVAWLLLPLLVRGLRWLLG